MFNSLKHEHRKQNIYSIKGLVDGLSESNSVMVIPSVANDFLDYYALLDNINRDLVGKVKINHIFSCSMIDINQKVIIDRAKGGELVLDPEHSLWIQNQKKKVQYGHFPG